MADERKPFVRVANWNDMERHGTAEPSHPAEAHGEVVGTSERQFWLVTSPAAAAAPIERFGMLTRWTPVTAVVNRRSALTRSGPCSASSNGSATRWSGRPGASTSAPARRWDNGDTPSLRWILVHMIEEYARHNGHADILREAVDGETGE